MRPLVVSSLLAVLATVCPSLFAGAAEALPTSVSSATNQRADTVLDDRALTRSGSWRSKVSSQAYLNTLSKSRIRGSRLTSGTPATDGGKVSLQFGPRKGKVAIIVGGVRRAVVSTAADTKQIRDVAFEGSGTVVIKVKKALRGVVVDAVRLKGAPPGQPTTPAAGELVVTEVMANPEAVSDSVGEWFELINASGHKVDLGGCRATDGSAGTSLLPDTVLNSGERLLLARSSDVGLNGGLDEDGTFTFALVDNSGSLSLLCTPQGSSETTIDTVTWTTSTASKSRSLSPGSTTATANDNDASWCLGQNLYNSTDYGTPDTANSACGG